MKTCNKCKIEKELIEFCKNKATKDGLAYTCRKCKSLYKQYYIKNPRAYKVIQAYGKQWKRDNPDKVRRSNLRVKYGITLEDYTRMLNEQNFCCKICGRNKDQLTRILCVDHDHKTGKVRGLLCHTCNRVLGLFNDDITILEKAVEYLK